MADEGKNLETTPVAGAVTDPPAAPTAPAAPVDTKPVVAATPTPAPKPAPEPKPDPLDGNAIASMESQLGYLKRMGKTHPDAAALIDKILKDEPAPPKDPRVDDMDSRLEAMEMRAIRAEVAIEVGLDAEAMNLISGQTAEEIKEKATALKKLLGDKKPAGTVTTETPEDEKIDWTKSGFKADYDPVAEGRAAREKHRGSIR